MQVLELGGSELTDELRSGRAVTPGRFHLGIDETVFCATAWLSDDGLRIDAPESARQRAGQLQEAIERLADTRRGVTAAQALVRIREAMDRVGSERRSASPLGVASARLRSLDRSLADARTRLAAVAVDQERLAVLDATLAAETDRWVAAERSRLSGAAVRRRRPARAPRGDGARGQAPGSRDRGDSVLREVPGRRRDGGDDAWRRAHPGEGERRRCRSTLAGRGGAPAADPFAARADRIAGIAAIGSAARAWCRRR